jgi:hypothetical protein
MPPELIRKHCAITTEGEKILETAIQRLGLSARAPKHRSEAIRYRTLDRTYWARPISPRGKAEQQRHRASAHLF